MGSTPPMRIRILEKSHICPHPPPPVNASLRLTFLDIPWLLLPPSQPLFFYHYSDITASFHSTSIVAKLKHSLSLALLQFIPFAGKLVTYRKGPVTPEILYSDGDSVRVTVAEAIGYGADEFDRLCSNNNTQKEAHVFHQLVPTCLEAPSEKDEDVWLCDCLAVQITCFPEARGFSLGFAYPHVVCDQRTFNNFLKSWASLCKFGDGLVNGLRPSYDRASFTGRNGLEPILVNQWWERRGKAVTVSGMGVSTGVVRATFVMGPVDIANTRSWIEAQCRNKSSPLPVLLSPYVVVCAFVWACLAKAQYSSAHKQGPAYFGFIAGGLSRLAYRVPANYFGNCVAFGRAVVATQRDLVGEGGVEVAAVVIAKAVKRLDKNVLGGAERWIEEWGELMESDVHVNVVGSPKVDLYEMDFGWGRPRKIEQVGIDEKGGVSLCESRDVKGGIEIGIVLAKPKMDAFSKLFSSGLHEFSSDASIGEME